MILAVDGIFLVGFNASNGEDRGYKLLVARVLGYVMLWMHTSFYG
jgi:hypothetical protein